MTMTGVLSVGLMGSIDREILRELAPRIEAAGFHALWLNEGPGGDSLAGLAAVAEATSRLALATGVLPFDRRPAAEIADAVEQLALPQDRLVLGVGSGGAPHPLALVAAGIDELRTRIDPLIVLGALGPRMRELGARASDGLLLSWLTPAIAAEQAVHARRAAEEAGRPAPRLVLYARAAVDTAARERLEAEAATYAGYPAYGANFARLGISASETTIGPDGVGDRIDEYLEVVDELVLRAITPEGGLDDLVRFVEHDELAERLAR
jgi:alkanesulfonate monooxygenase SsuD/methylene tetrahydromethanopterin reductase-like flavin-dependent oxidoreductase (luciferase family)